MDSSIFVNSRTIQIDMWRIFESLFHRKRGLELSDLRSWLRCYTGGGVILEKNDETGIATIKIDHPEKRNAFSGFMMTALEDAVASLETWPLGKGVLLYGSGHNFCSGGDLDFARKISNPTDGYRMATYMQAVLARLRNLPLLTAAVVEGSGALGGGAELAMACDWRLVTRDSAGIGFVHRRMGIAPAWGGTTYLVQVLGYRQALDIMTLGRPVGGQRAVDIGLADHMLESDDPLAEAKSWILERTYGPTQVVRTIKTMCKDARDTTATVSLQTEKTHFAPLWGGPANVEALASKIKHRL